MPTPILQRIALWGVRHYLRIFVCAAVVFAASMIASSRLRVDSDVLNLLPQRRPGGPDLPPHAGGVRRRRHAADPGRAAGRGSGGRSLRDVRRGAGGRPRRAAAARVRRLPHRRTSRSWSRPTSRRRSSSSTRTAASSFEQKLSDRELERRAAEIRRALATPQSLIAKRLIRIDPLGLAEVFLAKLSSSRGALRVDLSSGFFLSPDHRLLLLLAKPVQPAQNFAFTEELVAAVDAHVDGPARALGGDRGSRSAAAAASRARRQLHHRARGRPLHPPRHGGQQRRRRRWACSCSSSTPSAGSG